MQESLSTPPASWQIKWMSEAGWSKITLRTLSEWANADGNYFSAPVYYCCVGMHASWLIFFWKKLISLYFHAKISDFWDVGTVFLKPSGVHCTEGPVWPRIATFWPLHKCFPCRLREYSLWGGSFGLSGSGKTGSDFSFPLGSWLPSGKGKPLCI